MPSTSDIVQETGVESSTRENQLEKDKSSKSKGPSKAKDLSHVPCKFFKVGSCTAGPSCPFSHQTAEPGHQKEVCAWFVKGNCKFGHKCALAHILPGQRMSMDKQNKKAAQMAAGGGQGNGQRDRDGSGRRDKRPQKTQSTGGLLSGSTAPTRVLAGSRPPLPISKAVPAPAAPAPPLQDTDFASFDFAKVVAEKLTPEAVATSASASAASPATAPPGVDSTESVEVSNQQDSPTKSPFLPLSSPSQPLRFTGRHGSSPSVDFGPIGSPPRSSPSNPTRVDGFSPGASPRESSQHGPALISTSPFSAPGGQSLFMTYEQDSAADTFKGRSGLAASLGATRTLHADMTPPSQRSVSGPKVLGTATEALEDEDMEEFIPSSLTDLLTPGEKSRRMSRTSSTNPGVAGLANAMLRPSVQDHHHRYSRSVPAPSLLSDIKSIWASSPPAEPQAQRHPGFVPSSASQGMGFGTPSSHKSNSSFLSGLSENGPSPSFLSPSNASAAFLPGLHQHYLSRPSMGTPRSVSQTHYANDQAPSHPLIDHNGMSSLAPNHAYHQGLNSTNRNAGDPYSVSHSLHPQQPSGRPIPSSNTSFLGVDLPLSPSARALQAHAPGQSLPQGLAAGYSRIHVQPAPPNVPSPAMSGGAFSPGAIGGHVESHTVGSPDWLAISPSKNVMTASDPATDIGGDSDAGGLSSMFSRLSYSAAAAARASPPSTASLAGPGTGSPTGTVPMSMSRRPSGRGWSSHPLSSPLSGPVLTNDDDDLFSMDEEK